MTKKKIVVIGSGMGGLAAALRLAHLGHEVTVIEKRSRFGGRSHVIQEDGYRVDTGPTILVMKETLEDTYASIGLNMRERLPLTLLEPNYRIYFHDNTWIDLFSNMARLAEEIKKIDPVQVEHVFRFIGEGAKKFELGMPFVDRNFDHFTDLVNPVAGYRLLETGAHENLYRQVSNFFDGNDKLTKAFSFHSMFLGLSPFESLAMYSLITYADLALGMWYPKGGIYSIIEDMVSIAAEKGITMLSNAPAAEIVVQHGTVTGVRLADGRMLPADIVVSNADLPYTYQQLIRPEHRKDYPDRRIDSLSYACSGYLLYLGVDKIYDNVRHQGLYFSEDYRANLSAIFLKKTLPADPSFHINIPTVTDPSLAPKGHSLLYLLAPMPNLTADINWQDAAPRVRGQILDQLEKMIDPDIRSHIVWERQYTPVDFKEDFNAFHGTAFGSLSQGLFQSAYFRPHNKARDISGLYFVGQGTYPGIGMPMVHLSAKLVTERILQDWGSAS